MFPGSYELRDDVLSSTHVRFLTTLKDTRSGRYLEVRRQLVGGEDAQFDLREADLQVLKVVSFGRSCIFAGLLMKVFTHLLQLYKYKNWLFSHSTLCFSEQH